MTQVQMAEALDIAQQTYASYEVGFRRVPVSMLPTIARVLSMETDSLIGAPSKTRSKRGPAPKFQQHLERISQLPKSQQRFVLRMLETALAQHGV